MANRALIIANSVYDDAHFATLPAAAADAAALAEVLGAPGIGGFDVQTHVDVPQRLAMRALESFFTKAARDDLLLLHLSLHGWKDTRGRLHFVMPDTERDYLGSTAISAELVGDWMGHSRSRRIVVLLDCCYSGAFSMNARRRDAGPPTVDVGEPFAGNGRVVLTASTALQYAYEGEREVRYSRTLAQPSVFTAAVVRGLRDGSADLDGDGLVSVDELYDYVHEQVRERIADQIPTLSVDSAQGTIYLARSPRHGDTDHLAEMRAAALDPQPWKRIGSLHLVEQLLGSVREPTRDTARACLLGLIADTDREVAGKARQLWHHRGMGTIPTARAPRPAAPRPPVGGSGPIVGIDFGTTNSAIALYDGDDVRLIPNAEGALTTPSLVAITEDGEILVGTPAKRQAITNPDYTIRSAKLRLGTDWSITRGTVRLTAEDVAEHILRRLREDAEAYAGGPLHGAILTAPANFDLAQRAALVEAAGRAGIRALRVINEPTAAAVTYGLNREVDDPVLIFDLGGGTLDVALIEAGNDVVEVKANAGDNRLGGDDWDRRIVEHLHRRVRERYGVDLTENVEAIQRLQEAAEAAKIELSSASTTTITLPYLARAGDSPLHVEETLTRQEFEAMTQDLLERCREPVEQASRDAGIQQPELSRVILTGGATRMPAISELVSRIMNGNQPYRGLIPEGIVTGASLQGGILAGAIRDALLLDACSASFGLETCGGITTKVIERSTTIPTRRGDTFAIQATNQTAMVLHIVEGESEWASKNRSLAVLELTDLPPHPRDTPLVEVFFEIDVNGILHIEAKELRAFGPAAAALEFTGRTWTTAVNRSSVARAAALISSARWQSLRALVPGPYTPDRPYTRDGSYFPPCDPDP
ncbi:Hsp70 family protein [Streptomyces sp. NPDC057199]|uniref:caspase, EACC1-associated type n=1 Tax=Streptomyces sp. NPDC057199 TaxID=3346047 RepID=UPI003633DE38